MPSDKDIVVEARQLLASVPEFCADSAKIKHALFADAVERERESPFWGWTTQTAKAYAGFPELLRALADEVERLRECHATKHTHTIDCALDQKRQGLWGKDRKNANS